MLKFDGYQGLHGWQWIFIIEALLTIMAGVLVYFFLPDFPENQNNKCNYLKLNSVFFRYHILQEREKKREILTNTWKKNIVRVSNSSEHSRTSTFFHS